MSSALYLDSAYVVKFYVNEPDSPSVRKLVLSARTLCSSAWCRAEMACALHRHLREGAMSGRQVSAALQMFAAHVSREVWSLIPISDRLLRRAEVMIESLRRDVFLRAGDVVHLVSAQDAGFREIWTNDRHVVLAAPHFGLVGRSV